MPATVPLSDLRTAIRERADMPLADSGGVARELVSDTELNRWINASHRALHDLIIHAFGEDYLEVQASLTTLGTTDRIALPHDFHKLLGLELQIASGYPGQWVTLHRINRGERNRYNFPNAFPLGYGMGRAIIGYSIYGADLRFLPPPEAGLVIRADYVPLTPVLADSGTVVWNSPTSSDSLVINGTTIAGSLSAANAATAIAAISGLSATNNAGTITVTPLTCDTKVVWKTSKPSVIALTPSTPCWAAYADEFNGWLEYVTVDCTRKAKAKEESDISAELQELAELKERILNAAKDRDLGEPGTPTDVMGDGWGPIGSGWGF